MPQDILSKGQKAREGGAYSALPPCFKGLALKIETYKLKIDTSRLILYIKNNIHVYVYCIVYSGTRPFWRDFWSNAQHFQSILTLLNLFLNYTTTHKFTVKPGFRYLKKTKPLALTDIRQKSRYFIWFSTKKFFWGHVSSSSFFVSHKHLQ